MAGRRETATLAAGCFWCVEAVYLEVAGVERAVSGYIGGSVENPGYEAVCSGTTGHAEAVQVTFDPDVIGYDEILDIFWQTHDPTTLDRQGNDVGTQYRSAIFYHTEAQQRIAEQSKREADASKKWINPIVTEIVPATTFYVAEDYHQNFYQQNPYQPYCMMVVHPKMRKFRKGFGHKLKAAASAA